MKLAAVALAHLNEPGVGVRVQLGSQALLKGGKEPAEVLAPDHPLVVPATTMLVGTVEATSGERSLEPTEQRLVSHVHSERDLRLPPVASEMPLPHQQTDEDADLVFVRHDSAPLLARPGPTWPGRACGGAAVSPYGTT